MSHTLRGPSGATYAFNEDFSGGVSVEASEVPSRYHDTAVEIPFADIRALYLEYARRKAISRLEQAEDGELEALLFPGPQTAAETVPDPALPGWVHEAQVMQKKWTRYILRQAVPYQFIRPGDTYVHVEQPWVLAHVDELAVDGSVRFAVWDATRGRSWNGGVGLKTHDDFQSLYPLKYTGPGPELVTPS
jgi:hypothetical protein